jgi:hypothetical protein
MIRFKQDPEEGTTYNNQNTKVYDNNNKNKNNQRDFHTTNSTQQRKKYKFDERVQQLEKFKERYGNCYVTRNYDISLYKWCDNVRYTYKNQHKGEDAFRPVVLNPSRIKVLKELGFDFKTKQERNKATNLLISLYEDLDEDDDDEDLGEDDEDIDEDDDDEDLGEDNDEDTDEDDDDEDLGEDNDEEKMIPIQSFDDRIKALKEFKEKYGHLDVPWKSDRSLYAWCSNMRSAYKRMQTGKSSTFGLTNERIQILKDLGFDFRCYIDRNVSSQDQSTLTSSHTSSSQKSDRVKRKSTETSTSSKPKRKVPSFDSCSEEEDDDDEEDDDNEDNDNVNHHEKKEIQIQSFDDRIKALKEFKEKYGHLNVPWKSDQSLYLWCSSIRSGYKRMQNGEPSKRSLTNERIQTLKDLGFDFRFSKERSNPPSSDNTAQKGETSNEKVSSFDIYFDELKKFIEKYGHCEVTRKFSTSLSTWCYHMRSAYKSLAQGKPNSLLTPERVRLLEDVGFDFKYDGLISSNSILDFPQKRKRKQPSSAYSNQTGSNQRIKSELDISATGSAVRPGSPAFDLSRFTYEELLQQAEVNKAMCQRMEMKAKIRCKKSLKEIESSMFNSDEEDNSNGTFECRFCGLKFNFQCVCILHMPKCKAKTLNDPVLIQKYES